MPRTPSRKPRKCEVVMDAEETRCYQVVCNYEEQYSIWPTERPLPAGWRVAGPSGPRESCLEFISRTWTDMRPRSLREAMAEQWKQG